MIDLHIHTTSSDGSEEPVEILVRAQSAGLKYISITDHDTIGAYKKLEKMKAENYFSGKIITGCEFTVVHNKQPLEILGYGIELETLARTGIVSDEKFLDMENLYLKKMMKVCKNLGIKYSSDLYVNDNKYFASQILHSDIRKYPENENLVSVDVWESINSFYRTCVTNEESPFFIDKTEYYPSLQEAVKLIKASGGKAFLAHLYGYCLKNPEEYLDSLVSLNELDGFECYHSLHSVDKTEFLLDYCRKNNLLVSGGSDYHGKIKPNVRIGECIPGVKIPYSAVSEWLSSCAKL